ncbi:phosphoglycerate mutase 2, partial [Aureobasidium melanogenum]
LNFDTAVEEEGDVGVLFSLGDVALVDLLLGEPLGEDVVHGLGSEGEGEGVVGLVTGHGGNVRVGGVGEVGLGAAVLVADELGDFADTVAAVVEEEERVVVWRIGLVKVNERRRKSGHTLDSAVLAVDNDGLEELVGLALLVAGLDGLDGVGRLLALALDNAVHGLLDAVPALVTVHGVVTTDNSGDLAEAELVGVVEDGLHMAGARLGVGVTAVAEEVDVDLGHADLLGDLEQSEEVVDVRVDTAIRDETEQVQAAVALLCAGEALDDVVDLVEFALLDGLVDADNVLPDDSAGADVQVADLRVAHEALGETDGERRGLELGVALGDLAALLGELVHPGSVGVEDGVALVGRVLASDAPSVNADEDCLLCDLCHVDVMLASYDASGEVEEDVKECRREEGANNLQLSGMRKVQVE